MEKNKIIIQELFKVQNPCFDQNPEAGRNFGILVKKPQCNEAIFECQTIKDVFQNKLFLEFLDQK